MATEPEHVEHITSDGERWDQIAYKHYGNPLDFERILTANTHIPVAPTLSGGLRVLVPIIAETDAPIESELPPWKREA